jgi:hypothetical protein
MEALTWVASVAIEFGVEDLTEAPERLTFTFPVTLPSEECIAFRLEARPDSANHVSAREQTPERLPGCCPERHINRGGSFCMNWQDGDPFPVEDGRSARAWWALLWDFLTRQMTAAKLRRWPGPVRAHGIAANHQDRAEQCAARLGGALTSQLARRLFVTRLDQRRGRNRIELVVGEEVVNRINLPARTLANTAMPCPCAAGHARAVPIRDCQTHARDLAELIDAVHHWRRGEEAYVEDLEARGVRCCGSLDRCPLK